MGVPTGAAVYNALLDRAAQYLTLPDLPPAHVRHPGHSPQKVHAGGRKGSVPLGDAGSRFDEAATGDEALGSVRYTPSSSDVRRAIDDYGGEGPESYQSINDGLRGGWAFGVTKFTPQQQANVDGLDKAMKESRGAPRDMVVYRSADPIMFGLDVDQIAGRDMNGVTWRDKGFVSTASGGEWLKDTSRLALRILVPKGTKAISHSRKGSGQDGGGLDADEVLLDRGLTFRVIADRGYRRKTWKGDPDPYSGRDLDVEIIGG